MSQPSIVEEPASTDILVSEEEVSPASGLLPSDPSEIAEMIRERDSLARLGAAQVVENAIAIGALLTRSRELFDNQAEWLVWVADETGYQRTHAYRLMQLARHSDQLRGRLLEGDLSLRGALNIINESAAELRKLNYQARMRQLKMPVRPPEAGELWRIEQGDCSALPLPDDSVDVIITSPPYGLGINYADTDDSEGYDNYLTHAYQWTSEMWRVVRSGGRVLLNVPLDANRAGRKPMYADWLHLLRAFGFQYATSIIWHDGAIKGSTARGSVDSPSSPSVSAPVEMIIAVYKDHWKWQYIEGDFPHNDWIKFTGPAGGLWTITPEVCEFHPAVFPRELARRLIGIFSLPGQYVLDPFCGRGTTILEAALVGRKVLGIDKSQTYVELARQWVSERL